MSNLYIAEFPAIMAEHWQLVKMPPIAEQVVAIGAAVQSAAFSAQTRMIRVFAGAGCSIAIGGNPTATTSNCPLAANQTEFFGVGPGEILSVIANASP